MFRKLKGLMFEMDIDQAYLRKTLNRSQTYVTQRMMGQRPWSMDDVYAICDLLRIPYDQIFIYFPRGGRSAEEAKPWSAAS